EDAAYKMDNGIHFNMPSLINRPNQFGGGGPGQQGQFGQGPGDVIARGLEQINRVKSFFREAKAYTEEKHDQTNLKFEAVRGLF
ncbi:hypothetical protein, partial [Rhizobium leguminosarum]|uniref:hypothetical protein n=1 Tax=Rhizobium leguminosarum TaxID=384 RepID=UPI003F9CE93E